MARRHRSGRPAAGPVTTTHQNGTASTQRPAPPGEWSGKGRSSGRSRRERNEARRTREHDAAVAERRAPFGGCRTCRAYGVPLMDHLCATCRAVPP